MSSKTLETRPQACTRITDGIKAYLASTEQTLRDIQAALNNPETSPHEREQLEAAQEFIRDTVAKLFSEEGGVQ